MIRPKWWPAALAVLTVSLAAGEARAQAAPRDTGLIVSSLESAVAQPVRKAEKFTLTVDLSDRKLYVMDGDDIMREFPVSIGTSDYPTPQGSFRIRRMIWNPSWRPPPSAWARDDVPQAPGAPGNPMGRVKIFFQEPDYYIHGTGLTGSLGNARSHGCVRMRNIDAVELARMVMVNAGVERDADWYQKTIAEKTVSREVNLTRPIAIRVRP
jgi:lipoprotein-anchoring transpeptidase ErfK/SrfK